jgi:hypothetical protein
MRGNAPKIDCDRDRNDRARLTCSGVTFGATLHNIKLDSSWIEEAVKILHPFSTKQRASEPAALSIDAMALVFVGHSQTVSLARLSSCSSLQL